jgi:dsDNA-specific endonuclease/ATPase MutS2
MPSIEQVQDQLGEVDRKARDANEELETLVSQMRGLRGEIEEIGGSQQHAMQEALDNAHRECNQAMEALSALARTAVSYSQGL